VTAAIVAVLMWTLVASLLVLRRGRTERQVTYAALAIASAMTLSVDFVYKAVDELFDGSNWITLAADLTLMTGVFLLGRGVMKAFEYRPVLIRVALSRATLFAALGSAIVAFLLIDRGATTTNFMLDLGSQPAAASYSAIQFAYYGIVLSAMAVLAARQIRRSQGIQLLPPVLLVIGSALGILLAVVVLVMDFAHLVGDLRLMTDVSAAYSPMFLSTFLFLCAGFAGGPAARAVQALSRERKSRRLIDELTPVWAAATRVRPGISQSESPAIRAGGPEAWLHRQVVEIRDAMIDTRVSFEVGDHDREILERAESHLLGSGAASSQATMHHGQRSA
jgi:hypothetical protein